MEAAGLSRPARARAVARQALDIRLNAAETMANSIDVEISVLALRKSGHRAKGGPRVGLLGGVRSRLMAEVADSSWTYGDAKGTFFGGARRAA
jgi:hypothetical protein